MKVMLSQDSKMSVDSAEKEWLMVQGLDGN